MMRFLLACAALAASISTPALAALEMPSRALERSAPAPVAFRAPDMAPKRVVTLPAMAKAEAVADEKPTGPVRVGTVRPLAKAASLDQWVPVAGGFVTTLEASSTGASGLRVRLDLAGLSAPVEVRVQGTDGRIELMVADPSRGEAWTPWTEGASQRIELFTAAAPAGGAASVGGIVHFDVSPFEKAAASCTVSTQCSTGDPAVDAAIAERKKSIMRINYVRGNGSYLCSATLINTELFPSPYVLTANHCVDHAASANTITSWWFYESTSCDAASGINPNWVQVGGGMELVFGNYNLDASLLHMNALPPVGAVYAGYNGARISPGLPMVSLSHPTGDTSRLALGNTAGELGIFGYPQPMVSLQFTRGIIEGGSSGSGLFSMSGGSLQLRSILSGSTVRGSTGGLSCANQSELGLYSRFDIFLTQINDYIRATPRAADDAPNRARDLFNVPLDTAGNDAPLNTRGSIVYANRQLNFAGDLDVYRFVLSAPAVVSAYTEGTNLDTIGSILDSRGVALEANDDAGTGSLHFGLTRELQAGTYYVQVGHFEATGTGNYSLRIRADNLGNNYTALWYNPDESGWGVNVNHQGNIVFATLFTYDASGQPMWLVMDRGELQPDGAYVGNLYRVTGPAFNAVPFSPAAVSAQAVGTMRFTFAARTLGQVSYTVNGVPVTKGIVRQEFSTPPTCTWSAFDRAYSDNYQDLWYNPSESGWGINLTHQGDIIFATLFTYDANGRGMWYVMDRGVGNGSTFSGTLYRTTGPAFNATPFNPSAVVATAVGTMSLSFQHGNAATLTYTVNGVQVVKQIQRQVFQELKPSCQ